MTMNSSTLSIPSDEYIQHIVEIHFNPKNGTPYWLNRDRKLGTEAYKRVKSFADLKQLIGFRNAEERRQFENDTRYLPLETFIPQSIINSGRRIWASQTGGTTGSPKHGNWDNHYFDRILTFSDEFLNLHLIPRDVNWLFIGPMGPHTTGRLVVAIAENRGGRCFSIDLDPRIVKIFGTEGATKAYNRYIEHIWDQVEPIIKYQSIGVVFCTSRLLEILPEHLDVTTFKNVKGFVHAGTTMEPDTNRLLRDEIFPGTPLVGIYGTSTTGISYQKPAEIEDSYRVVYIPSSPFIVLEIVDDQSNLVDYGNEGHVATYRLTEDSLIPGFWERDRAVRLKPFGTVADHYHWDWVGNPYSPEFTVEGKVEGVY